jgi:hypothetical protein
MACAMSKNTRIAVVLFELGVAVGCAIALIQGNGQLAVPYVLALGVLGTVCIFLAMLVLGWHRAPLWIGIPIKIALLLILSAIPMGTVCWYVWPETLAVYPAEPFTFINPPTPNETFTITATNRALHSIYRVQFSLVINDENAKLDDFSFGIPYESLKVLNRSEDKFRYSADILLFRCGDHLRHPLFRFLIPELQTLSSREVTITAVRHSTATGYAKPISYDEKPHSISRMDNEDIGFSVPRELMDTCGKPWLVFMDSGDRRDGRFQGPTN